MRDAKDTYRRFIAFEEQAAAIYLRMASLFSPENPELGALWLDMGIQEKQHAGLLQFCLAEELFATELPSDKEIYDIENLFSRLRKRAVDAELSIDGAFRIALDLETSEVNAIYDALTTPMHASMYLLRKKIATSMPDHLGHLLQEARRFKVPEESLQELERRIPQNALTMKKPAFSP
jgi:rubrerythrin